MLETGNPMPDFSAQDQNGNIVSSRDLIGKKTVVYFYPKANTPGCTAEACSLRDNYERFLALGYNVIGISKDSVKAQKNFSDKYTLPFPLLSDPETLIIKAFGAWGEKKLYGKVYEGILRKTFIFNEKGILVEVIDKVNTKNHAEQILG
ncbi:bacterioferritin comigratory protein [Bacteroides sp. CAG:770]|nr:bacterioferritin comigratory protein [Bacteroides sp. CAG:770]